MENRQGYGPHCDGGTPDMIRRFSWREVWIYGDEGTSNCIIYIFNKRSHDLDDKYIHPRQEQCVQRILG